MDDPTNRSRLHRSRNERLLFGVCGGLAERFHLDPTIVRIGFVLAALFPPTSGVSVLGYVLLAVILPEEGTEHLPARDRVGRNLDSLRSEVSQLAGTLRSRVTGTPRQGDESRGTGVYESSWEREGSTLRRSPAPESDTGATTRPSGAPGAPSASEPTDETAQPTGTVR